MQYAEVAVNAPVDQTFHYHIPPEMQGELQPGYLVRVGFGTAEQPGIVMALHESSPIEQTKPILEIYDPEPVVTPAQMALAGWISAQYATPIGISLWVMLPPGIAGRRDMRVTLLDESAAGDDTAQRALIDLLQRRGPLTGEQISRSQGKGWQKTVRLLKQRGVVRTQSILLPPRVRPRRVKVAALAIAPDHIPYVRARLGKPNPVADALEMLLNWQHDEDLALIPVEDVYAIPGVGDVTFRKLLGSGAVHLVEGTHIDLTETAEDVWFKLRNGKRDEHILRVLAREDGPVDLSWVYAQTGAKLDDLKRLEASGLVVLGEKEDWRDPLADRHFVPLTPPRLTPGQRQVWQVVRAVLDTPAADRAVADHVLLLHGVTGSGKTEIYLRAIDHVIRRGRQAIFLVPEIALTPQTIRRVLARFPSRVAIVHSRLSDGERYDTWRRARMGEIDVVVGTRAALFTPLPDCGLVILDEEHDHSYKQAPPVIPPYYHARPVAERMMRDQGGLLILGSATPDLETRYRAEQGEIRYLHLPDRIMGHRVRIAEQGAAAGLRPRYAVEPSGHTDAVAIDLPAVDVVDMRTELKSGNTSMFSRALHDALTGVLARGQQAILFLNRRGTSTYVFCRDCGHVAACPRCETPLTYHEDSNLLHCHHCGHSVQNLTQCPACGSRRIKYFGAGTQQVETAFRDTFGAAFPQATALRWDGDSAAGPGQHDLILSRFLAGEADVLIGTQMIAKGLDLPLVTLVGVISGDIGLNLPDFRAVERNFQVLMQVAGRAGRGLLGGNVILQTYQPDHYAIQAAAAHNYDGFYVDEIGRRRAMGYPPFRRLVRVLLTNPDERQAREGAIQAAHILRERLGVLDMTDTSLIGPVPCFYTRLNRIYRWQVVLRGPNPVRALRGFDVPRGWLVDVDPTDLL
ncbi:MAG: replication restart helicase PriA [Chloroflexota bacterium]